MLDDGIQYEDIIQRLGDAGKNLNKQNIHIPHENLKISRASAKYHDMSHCCNCAN
jgi:ribosomal protein L9